MNKCLGATRLMSLKRDRPLTTQERVSLRLHLMMCPACRQCDKQFSLLHEAGSRLASERRDNHRRD